MAGFNSPTPHLFAHRGGNAAGGHENTISAFEAAVKLGYKFLETDVIATKDSQVVTYHGSANLIMKLIFGLEIRRKVQQLSYEQFNDRIDIGGEAVPKLQDVLSRFKEQSFCIDVKTDQAVEPLVELIKRHNAKSRVVITSFKKRRSIRASKLLHGDSFTDACLCVYRIQGLMISFFPTIAIARLKKQGFGYIHIPYKCVTKRLLKEAKRQNFIVYAWTVNKEDEINKLLSWKIDGIISDEAELLVNLNK